MKDSEESVLLFIGHGETGTISKASVAVMLWPIRLQCFGV